ncbi:MAG: 50S ribosomal protein L10, partial [Actinobacteria bacterium]|nr:50S ribosomal protein L10 [Actinomycetota bacterium]
VAVVDRVRDELRDKPATLLTDYRGLTVSQMAELRAQLRAVGARYAVVKNTLAIIAAKDAGYEGLDEVLSGPTALTFCEDDPVGPAKVLRKFTKDHPQLVLKGAIFEGRIMDAATADKLADLESREELLGRMAGMMYAALARAASMLQAPLGQMARLMAALEAEGGAPGAPQAQAPAPASAPEGEAASEAEAAPDDAPAGEAADEAPPADQPAETPDAPAPADDAPADTDESATPTE